MGINYIYHDNPVSHVWLFRSNRIINQVLNYIANWALFHNIFKGRYDKFALVLDKV